MVERQLLLTKDYFSDLTKVISDPFIQRPELLAYYITHIVRIGEAASFFFRGGKAIF